MININQNIPEYLEQRTRLLARAEGIPPLQIFGPVMLPLTTLKGTIQAQWYVWQSSPEELENPLSMPPCGSALVIGDLQRKSSLPLVRMHSVCVTGDVFHSARCDCGDQLNRAIQQLVQHGTGVLLYLGDQEGRGIGLYRKAMAYALQQEFGLDTLDANLALGQPADARSYRDAAVVLRFLCDRPIILLTNNPLKPESLEAEGISIRSVRPLWASITPHNRAYLNTKVQRFGHTPEEEIM